MSLEKNNPWKSGLKFLGLFVVVFAVISAAAYLLTPKATIEQPPQDFNQFGTDTTPGTTQTFSVSESDIQQYESQEGI